MLLIYVIYVVCLHLVCLPTHGLFALHSLAYYPGPIISSTKPRVSTLPQAEACLTTDADTAWGIPQHMLDY